MQRYTDSGLSRFTAAKLCSSAHVCEAVFDNQGYSTICRTALLCSAGAGLLSQSPLSGTAVPGLHHMMSTQARRSSSETQTRINLTRYSLLCTVYALCACIIRTANTTLKYSAVWAAFGVCKYIPEHTPYQVVVASTSDRQFFSRCPHERNSRPRQKRCRQKTH